MTQKEMIYAIQRNLVKAENELRKASVFVSQAREELARICQEETSSRSSSKR